MSNHIKCNGVQVVVVVLVFAGGYMMGLRQKRMDAGVVADVPNAAVFPGEAVTDAGSRIKSLEGQVEDLRARLEERADEIVALAAEKEKLTTANATIKAEVEKMNKEWTFSYGTTRDAGKFLGSMLRDGVAMRGMDPNDPEAATKARDMFLKFASMGPILQEMQKIDDKPKEFAEFRASILGEALGLDDAGRDRVIGIVEKYKTTANAMEIDSPERVQLNQRAMEEVTAAFADEQKSLLGEISNSGMGGGNDLLETPSLDPVAWRKRMQRNNKQPPAERGGKPQP